MASMKNYFVHMSIIHLTVEHKYSRNPQPVYNSYEKTSLKAFLFLIFNFFLFC